jgi:hypothetical protein
VVLPVLAHLQVVLHLLFSADHVVSVTGEASPFTVVQHVHSGLVPALGMLIMHAWAVLLTALWLARGEAAIWTLLRRLCVLLGPAHRGEGPRVLDDHAQGMTGTAEHYEPDFDKLTPAGLPVISEYAHIRRAHVRDPTMRILRRAYNYDEGLTAEGRSDSGLLFASYQADITRQFIPIQKKLAKLDLLNAWTTPIGSAVFAVPPGCSPTGWIGETLLT